MIQHQGATDNSEGASVHERQTYSPLPQKNIISLAMSLRYIFF